MPTLLKGTGFLFNDLIEKPHLLVWALLAGMLWAVGNTLTIFAVRNVGLAIAFPLWNTNSLVGLAWGCLLFRELRGSRAKDWAKVLGGAAAIVFGAAVLAIATAQQNAGARRVRGIGIIAAGAGRGRAAGHDVYSLSQQYISGMNPLSFVTIFTFGELGTVFLLGWIFYEALHRCWPSSIARGRCFSGRFWRILLGDRRSVPKIMRPSIWNRARDSAF